MLASRAGLVLQGAGVDPVAGTDLGWAWLNIGAAAAGAVVVERLATDQMNADLKALSRLPYEVSEVVGMSLAFEDSMTALDLCADAIFLTCGRARRPDGRFYDVGYLKKEHQSLNARAAIAEWIAQFLLHSELPVLEACRHSLAHRHVPRSYMMRLARDAPIRRGPSEITIQVANPHGQLLAETHSIGELIPRMVGFAETQIEAVCTAILRDFAPSSPAQ